MRNQMLISLQLFATDKLIRYCDKNHMIPKLTKKVEGVIRLSCT